MLSMHRCDEKQVRNHWYLFYWSSIVVYDWIGSEAQKVDLEERCDEEE